LENKEEAILTSSTQLVSLNTRIPEHLSKKINECVGMLQTTSNLLTYSKQSVVHEMLLRGYHSIREEFERDDLTSSGPDVSNARKEHANVISVSEQIARNRRSIDPQVYAEISNPTPGYRNWNK
jgi:hypothetical protein